MAEAEHAQSNGHPEADKTQDASQSHLGMGAGSATDTYMSKRPRDSRLLHTILANYGVNSYQERVPLQLIDLAYRYTASILQDALHFTNDGYGPNQTSGSTKATAESHTVNLAALRLAIHSKTHYQYSPSLPKEVYLELATMRNNIALPPVSKEWGMKLPPEHFLQTGQSWELAEADSLTPTDLDITMENQEVQLEDADEEENGEGGTMEDIFGVANDDDDEMKTP